MLRISISASTGVLDHGDPEVASVRNERRRTEHGDLLSTGRVEHVSLGSMLLKKDFEGLAEQH